MGLRRRKGVRELQIRVVLCFEPIFNILVQLLVPAGGFRSVKVTSPNNIQVWSRKVECLSDNVEVPDGDELFKRVSR